MKEWTGIEIERATQELERASATLLGRMLFEFSRLDMALGLMLVWSADGKQVSELTSKIQEFGFSKKLDFLATLAKTKFREQGGTESPYAQWLDDADALRQVRNELVHGRWGVEPTKNRVINVIGLPTSPSQRTVEYTTDDLKHVVERLVQLQRRLSTLRLQSPL